MLKLPYNRLITWNVVNGIKKCSTGVNTEDLATESHIRATTNFQNLSKFGTDFGIENKDILLAVNKSPNLLQVPLHKWESCFTCLSNNGFTGEQCIRMIVGFPKLLDSSPKTISEVFEIWNQCQFGMSNLLRIFINAPELLVYYDRHLFRKINHLKQLSSKKDVINILSIYPRLIASNWDEIQEKVDYIENKMRINRKNILKTSALVHNVSYIKMRHAFIARAGIYIQPSIRATPDTPNNNPSLSQILDTSDVIFATKISKLTIEEYEAFKEAWIYEEESDNETEDNLE